MSLVGDVQEHCQEAKSLRFLPISRAFSSKIVLWEPRTRGTPATRVDGCSAQRKRRKNKKEVDFLNSAKTTIQISTGILFIRQALRERVADKGMQGFPGTLPIPVVGHLIYGPERMLKSTSMSIGERMVVIVGLVLFGPMKNGFLKLSGGLLFWWMLLE
ncbi:hypothetical protein CEXT_683251 [Caerostris extrusa]|uniref:Uncharacterized protein n=1 Tax=Caerostris extrusa TaxID=172846 RepID=A0AAV4V804_CAEEX|nr:hypothetical protein CEXT_683251 [Caerostris extrusa]